MSSIFFSIHACHPLLVSLFHFLVFLSTFSISLSYFYTSFLMLLETKGVQFYPLAISFFIRLTRHINISVNYKCCRVNLMILIIDYLDQKKNMANCLMVPNFLRMQKCRNKLKKRGLFHLKKN